MRQHLWLPGFPLQCRKQAGDHGADFLLRIARWPVSPASAIALAASLRSSEQQAEINSTIEY